MSIVVRAVCFSRLTQSEYSSGKNNISFNAVGKMLRNGITRDNDFQSIAKSHSNKLNIYLPF